MMTRNMIVVLGMLLALAREPKVKDVSFNITQVFLKPPTTLECLVTLTEKPFNGKIKWYCNGNLLKEENDWIVSQTEPKIFSELLVTSPGNCTCQVIDDGYTLNATAVVSSLEAINEFVVREVKKDGIQLDCPKGPEGTSVFIQHQHIEDKRVQKKGDQSIILKNPDLHEETVMAEPLAADAQLRHFTNTAVQTDLCFDDLKSYSDSELQDKQKLQRNFFMNYVLRDEESCKFYTDLKDAMSNFTCLYAFDSDLKKFGSILSIPPDRTASKVLPVIFYKTIDTVQDGITNYSVTFKTLVKNVRVKLCAINNSEPVSCQDNWIAASPNVSYVNISVYVGTDNIYRDTIVKGEGTETNEPEPDRQLHPGAIVGIVLGGIIVVAVIVIVIYIRFFRHTTDASDGEPNNDGEDMHLQNQAETERETNQQVSSSELDGNVASGDTPLLEKEKDVEAKANDEEGS